MLLQLCPLHVTAMSVAHDVGVAVLFVIIVRYAHCPGLPVLSLVSHLSLVLVCWVW